MTKKQSKAYICAILLGLILIMIGLLIQVPGGALTTYESMDGRKTSVFVFDDKYSAIDEYVGGDAYNYIIGASLVAGKISGTIAAKAIFIVGGTLCFCIGIISIKLCEKNITVKNTIPDKIEDNKDDVEIDGATNI